MKAHKEDFIKALSIMGEIYGTNMSKASILAYYRLLEQYPWEKVKTALEWILRTSSFFPKPAEFIALVEQRDDQLNEEVEILNAWKALLFEFKKTSQIENPRFEGLDEEQKRKLHETINTLGGWRACCMWEIKDYPHLFRLFSQIYRTVSLAQKVKQQKAIGSKEEPKKLPEE